MFKAYQEQVYVKNYRDLYIRDCFWQAKYRCNETIISHLLRGSGAGLWIDLCCGQGQYFVLAEPSDNVRCIGIDASDEQLTLAKGNRNERTRFIVADVCDRSLPGKIGKAHLVTLMWGAYCYLEGLEGIRTVFANVANLLRPGGLFYLEVIEPLTLENFNGTEFARRSGTSVEIISKADGNARWMYEDPGGTHQLFAPSLKWVLSALADFNIVAQNVFTVQTLHQVVGLRRASADTEAGSPHCSEHKG